MGNTFSRIAVSTMLLITMGVAPQQAGGANGGIEETLEPDPIQEGGPEGGLEEKRTCDCVKRHQGPCHGGNGYQRSHIRQPQSRFVSYDFWYALNSIQESEWAQRFVDRGINDVKQLKSKTVEDLVGLEIPGLNMQVADTLLWKLKTDLSLGEAPQQRPFVDRSVLPPRTGQVDPPASETIAVPVTFQDILQRLSELDFYSDLVDCAKILEDKGYEYHKDLAIAEPDDLIDELGLSSEQACRIIKYAKLEKKRKLLSRR